MAASFIPAITKEKKAKPKRGILPRGWFQRWTVVVASGGGVSSSRMLSSALDDELEELRRGFVMRRDSSRSDLPGVLMLSSTDWSLVMAGSGYDGGGVTALVTVAVSVAIMGVRGGVRVDGEPEAYYDLPHGSLKE